MFENLEIKFFMKDVARVSTAPKKPGDIFEFDFLGDLTTFETTSIEGEMIFARIKFD